MSEEWQHPDHLADRFRGVLQDLDRCSPLNAHVAKNAAAAIREVLRVYRFLDELFGATATAHLNAIEAQAAEIKRLRGIVVNYVDPFDVTPDDEVFVEAVQRAALGETNV